MEADGPGALGDKEGPVFGLPLPGLEFGRDTGPPFLMANGVFISISVSWRDERCWTHSPLSQCLAPMGT